MYRTSTIGGSALPNPMTTAMDADIISELAPEAGPDSSSTPELCLLSAVMQMALRDLQKPRHRDEALAFIETEEFELFCEWLGWDVEGIRRAAVEGMVPLRIIRK